MTTRGTESIWAVAIPVTRFVAPGPDVPKQTPTFPVALAKPSAAGVPLVEMAGGIVSNYPSGDFDLNTGKILACSPEIKNELINELEKVKPLTRKSYGGK